MARGAVQLAGTATGLDPDLIAAVAPEADGAEVLAVARKLKSAMKEHGNMPKALASMGVDPEAAFNRMPDRVRKTVDWNMPLTDTPDREKQDWKRMENRPKSATPPDTFNIPGKLERAARAKGPIPDVERGEFAGMPDAGKMTVANTEEGPWKDYAAPAAAADEGPWKQYGGGQELRAGHSDPVKPPTFGEKVGRQVGRVADIAVKAATDVPYMIADLPFQAANVIGSGIFGAEPYETPSQFRNRQLSNYLPQAETPAERVTERVVGGGISALTGAGAARAVAGRLPVGGAVTPSIANLRAGVTQPMPFRTTVQNFADQLAADPGTQAVAGMAGGAGAAGAELLGLPPIAQMGAGMLASGAVAGGPAANQNRFGLLPGATKSVFGGGTPQNIRRIQENKATLEAAGINPTPAQVTQAEVPLAMEGALTKMVGGRDAMMRRFREQQDAAGAKVKGTAAGLGTPDEVATGKIIKEGITGDLGWQERWKDNREKLYAPVNAAIPQGAPVATPQLDNALAQLTRTISGLPETSKVLWNNFAADLRQRLAEDRAPRQVPGAPATPPSAIVGPNGQPLTPGTPAGPPTTVPGAQAKYEALDQLRKMIGDKISDAHGSLTPDIPVKQLRRLYAAASQDQEAAVRRIGSPEALGQYRKAQAYTQAGFQRMENIYQPILDKKVPEQIYQAAVSGADTAPTKVMTIMKGLKEPERNAVRSTFINDLGRARSMDQNATGTKWSSERFLTEWDHIDDKVKAVMFAGDSGKTRRQLDEIAKSANLIRDTTRAWANASGTTPSGHLTGIAQRAVGGAVGGALAGAPGAAIGAVVSPTLSVRATQLITNRMVLNPKFIDWLATANKRSPAAMPALLNTAARQFQDDPDITTYLDAVRSDMAEQ